MSPMSVVLVCVLAALMLLAFGCDAEESRLDVPHADSPYGINQRLDEIRARDVDLMPEMGITWVRVHFFWDKIEAAPGEFDWTVPDEAMANCTRKGFGVLARINTPPAHACDPPNEAIGNAEKFAAFTRKVLDRYPGQIHAVEVMNEENVNRWPGVWERAAREYVPVLQATYQAVKDYNPEILVVSAGIWQHPMYYLEDMYKAGAKGYFDVFNFHYYTEAQAIDQGGPRYFDAMRGSLSYLIAYHHDVMKRYGDDQKPIWLTEFGWSCTPESQSHGVGEELQASLTVDAYDICRTSGLVTKVFPYTFHNTDGMAMIHEGDTSKQYGPSAAANHKRKIFYALRDYAKHYPTWQVDEPQLDLGPDAADAPLAITNADMEQGMASWTAANETQAAADSEQTHSGQSALKVSTDGQGPAVVSQGEIPVEPARGYEVRGWLYMTGGKQNEFYPHGMVEITFRDADGQPIDVHGPLSDNRAGKTISTQYFVSETFGEWYEVHYPFRAPDNAATAEILLALRPPNFRKPYDPVPGEAWFDDIAVKPFQLAAKTRKEKPNQ